MNKENKYEIAFYLILIIGGLLFSIIGYLIFPMVALVFPVGVFSFIYGSIGIIIYVKKLIQKNKMLCYNRNIRE